MDFRYQFIKNRVMDLHEEAAEYRRAREVRSARKTSRSEGRRGLRAAFGKRRTS